MAINEQPLNNDRPMAATELACKIEAPTFSLPNPVDPLPFCFCDYQCEYKEKAFADDGVDNYKNDSTPLLVALSSGSDSVFFRLVFPDGSKLLLEDGTHGIEYGLGFASDQPLLAGFLVQWWKIFDLFGGGDYQIEVTQNISGNDFVSMTHKYKVMKYSVLAAKGTVKVQGSQTGCFENGLDYPAAGWYQSIRVPGFFGNPEKVYELTNYPNTNRRVTQIQDRVNNEYTLSIRGVPLSIRDKLADNAFLANDLDISDYNPLNVMTNGMTESYEGLRTQFKRNNVALIEESDADNPEGSVYGFYEYRFEDRIKNKIKRN